MSAVVDRFDPSVDAGAFAEQLLGQPLWPHQLELVRSRARYRVVCAGRQSGKSRTLAVLALHTAATRRNALVLLVSAGETASRRLLEECAALAMGSPLLRGSVLDESKASLTLSNGSRILSVPASQRQIRGWPVDLLIVDEAAFIEQEIWRAAEPAIIARPGSRVVLTSSPGGGVDHFFRVLWRRGVDAPDDQVAGWHWPSSISPLVDEGLLGQIRERESEDYFRREYLAEFTQESGTYFDEAELMGAVEDFELVSAESARLEAVTVTPGLVRKAPAVVGVDWGLRRDANAVAVVCPLAGRRAVFVPWLAARSGWAWHEFAGHVADLEAGYRLGVVASEVNGVGDAATEILREAFRERGVACPVAEVWTDMRRKQAGFGKIRALLQQGLLVLPRHPELLKQLRALEFEQTDAGGLRIAVPERAGHDDLAMALMQAVSCLGPVGMWSWDWDRVVEGHRPAVEAGSGWFSWPQGLERRESW